MLRIVLLHQHAVDMVLAVVYLISQVLSCQGEFPVSSFFSCFVFYHTGMTSDGNQNRVALTSGPRPLLGYSSVSQAGSLHYYK